MRLALVRHGSTVVSDEGRFAGSSDVALSDRGREEARSLGRRLARVRFAAIYSSPLQRCLDTASLIAEGHDLVPSVHDELVEIDHGRWEGLTPEEVEARFAQEHEAWVRDPFSFAPEGGSTGARVVERVVPFVHRLVHEHAGEQVLVVSHKGTIRLTAAILLGIDPRRYRDLLSQQPCALNVFEFRDPGRARLLLFNDVSHLASDTADTARTSEDGLLHEGP